MQKYDPYWLAALDKLEMVGRLRRLQKAERLPGAKIRIDDGPILLDFSSNDYLGLSWHPALALAAQEHIARFGVGSGASRLVAGNLPVLEEIENKLANGKGFEAALVFVSGVQANLTILPALLDVRTLGAEPLVYADRLNHASLIQGCIAGGAKQIRFQHNDMAHLEELLYRDRNKSQPRFIITESVFSMDGDCPNLERLSLLAEKFDAFLYIDEAHATGVLGAGGFGLASGLNNALVVGTFSKGLGGFGAYAVGSTALREYLVNRCGGIIYATAPPPAILGAMSAALDTIPKMNSERIYLSTIASHLRDRLMMAGINTGRSTTQIVPVIVGEERRTQLLTAQLKEMGFYAAAIRPPSVPKETSRLRLAISAMHSHDEVDHLADNIIRLLHERD